MTPSGKVDYDQVARAQALLLTRGRLSSTALVAAYRTVRGATPGVYTEQFIEALISHGRDLGGDARVAVWAEAAELARQAEEADPRLGKLLVGALGCYQLGLSDIGRRAEALDVCFEMARAGRRAYDNGVVASPTFGTWDLACRLAEEGRHAEAARLFEAIVCDPSRLYAGRDWTQIAWIAELEAAGEHRSARSALQRLVDEHRGRAERHAGPFALVVWESLLLVSMDREHGREREAEHCDLATGAVLARLAADGEPKTWGSDVDLWVVLAGLTAGMHDRPASGEPGAPLFADAESWSPDVRRRYLGEGRDELGSEVARIAELADQDPEAHLGALVEAQREFTWRTARQGRRHHRTLAGELRSRFDEGVRLARRLADVDEPRGRAALARALADRTGMHVAARDFPPASSDFQRARLVAAGGPLDGSDAYAAPSLTA